jgi:hypothetical protein
VFALDCPGDVVGDLEAWVRLSGPERRLVAPSLHGLLHHVPNRVTQHHLLPVDLERRGDDEQIVLRPDTLGPTYWKWMAQLSSVTDPMMK